MMKEIKITTLQNWDNKCNFKAYLYIAMKFLYDLENSGKIKILHNTLEITKEMDNVSISYTVRANLKFKYNFLIEIGRIQEQKDLLKKINDEITRAQKTTLKDLPIGSKYYIEQWKEQTMN